MIHSSSIHPIDHPAAFPGVLFFLPSSFAGSGRARYKLRPTPPNSEAEGLGLLLDARARPLPG